MMENKSPALAGASSTGSGIETHSNYATPDRPIKWRRILAELYAGSSLNRFEAERIGDHTLHSTVSAIQRKGVTILRRMESVPGFRGCATAVCRYSLDRQPENLARAIALLEGRTHTNNQRKDHVGTRADAPEGAARGELC